MNISTKPLHFLIKIVKFIFLLAFPIGLVGCNILGLSQATLVPVSTTPVDEEIESEVLVTFFVEIPSNTPANEPILLSILDEVTGLALNAKRFKMESIDETHYKLTLPFELGSIVKYRFSRQGEILAEEHITDGRQVGYRLFHVTAPGEVAAQSIAKRA